MPDATRPVPDAQPPTPLLVSSMQRHPIGEVRHIPGKPIGMCGTSAAGFLSELAEWEASIRLAEQDRVAELVEGRLGELDARMRTKDRGESPSRKYLDGLTEALSIIRGVAE